MDNQITFPRVYEDEISKTSVSKETMPKININLSSKETREFTRFILEYTNSSVLYELGNRIIFKKIISNPKNIKTYMHGNEIMISNDKFIYYITKNNGIFEIREGMINEHEFTPKAFIRIQESDLKKYNARIIEIISELRHYNQDEVREFSKYDVKVVDKKVENEEVIIKQRIYLSNELDEDIEVLRRDTTNTYKMRGI